MTFFFNKDVLAKDSLEVLQRKLALYLSNRDTYMKLFYMKKAQIDEKNIFKLYWNNYISKGGTYDSFDEDFWSYAGLLNFQEKLDIRDILQTHIKDNIYDFMEHYPVSQIAKNSWFQSVFYKYNKISDDGISFNGNKSDWMPNFITLIESIEDKSSKLEEYIDECKQIA